jgi:hypothetical protein
MQFLSRPDAHAALSAPRERPTRIRRDRAVGLWLTAHAGTTSFPASIPAIPASVDPPSLTHILTVARKPQYATRAGDVPRSVLRSTSTHRGNTAT